MQHTSKEHESYDAVVGLHLLRFVIRSSLCICEDISIPCVLLPLFYLIGTQFIFRQGIQRVCIEFVHISRMSIPLTESIF